jgi:hypothetical protein
VADCDSGLGTKGAVSAVEVAIGRFSGLAVVGGWVLVVATEWLEKPPREEESAGVARSVSPRLTSKEKSSGALSKFMKQASGEKPCHKLLHLNDHKPEIRLAGWKGGQCACKREEIDDLGVRFRLGEIAAEGGQQEEAFCRVNYLGISRLWSGQPPSTGGYGGYCGQKVWSNGASTTGGGI